MKCHRTNSMETEQEIPRASHQYTPVSVKATAGLRQLPQSEQDWLVECTRKHLSRGSFEVKADWTRVLSGSEEALFDWMAVSFSFYSTRAEALASDPPTEGEEGEGGGVVSSQIPTLKDRATP